MPDSGETEILLVEDNPTDLELALRVFKKHRIANRIEVARWGGGVGFSLRRRRTPIAGAFRFRKSFCSTSSCPRSAGFEVLRRIKGDPRTRTIPIVVLTSSREEKDLLESYQLGVNSYIVKPVDFDQFSDCLRDIGMYWLLSNAPPKIHAPQ